MSPRLAIAIPAFNRAEVLYENLLYMAPELRETGTPVHISDDSSDGEVGEAVARFAGGHPGVHYVRNRPALGHDANSLRSIGLPGTEYVWLLGDSMRIRSGGLGRVLALIGSDRPDFVAVSSAGRRRIDVPTGWCPDPVTVLERLAWHLTLTGATVFRREILDRPGVCRSPFPVANFVQLGIVLAGLPGAEKGLYWINEPWIESHPGRSDNYWLNKVFEVFVKDWADFIMRGLPDRYPMAARLAAVRSHSRNTGLLEWKSLNRFRRRRILTYAEFRRHRQYWRLVSGVPAPLIAALSITPAALLEFLHRPLGGRRPA